MIPAIWESLVAVINPFKKEGDRSSRMGKDEGEVRIFLEKAAVNHLGYGQGRIHDKTDQGDERPLGHGFRVNRDHGMKEDREVHPGGLFIKGPEFFHVKMLSIDVRSEDDTLHPQVLDAPLELGDRIVRMSEGSWQRR